MKICPHSVQIWIWLWITREGYIRVGGIIPLEDLAVARSLFSCSWLFENKSVCTDRVMFIFKGENKHNAGVTRYNKLHIDRRTYCSQRCFLISPDILKAGFCLQSLHVPVLLSSAYFFFPSFYWNVKLPNTKVPWTQFNQALYVCFYLYACRRSINVSNLSLQSRLELGGQSDWEQMN